ncbi:hypothetical protein [Halomonas sp. YLGW01]|uniref:hypothetical protein n=1 Tax=Halomonas sp. YLGW01 TaxID=2773308 RepID=UPI00178749FE|nr:hypothetical protein [Halomonas sp. YLGW01]
MRCALLLAGCSYTPARLEARPLLEIDGYHGHRSNRHYDGRHHEERHYDVRRYDVRHYEERRRHRDRDRYRDESHRGGFCPPGQAMKGRC